MLLSIVWDVEYTLESGRCEGNPQMSELVELDGERLRRLMHRCRRILWIWDGAAEL